MHNKERSLTYCTTQENTTSDSTDSSDSSDSSDSTDSSDSSDSSDHTKLTDSTIHSSPLLNILHLRSPPKKNNKNCPTYP